MPMMVTALVLIQKVLPMTDGSAEKSCSQVSWLMTAVIGAPF